MKLKKLPVIAAVCLSSMLSSLHSAGFAYEKESVPTTPRNIQELINNFAGTLILQTLSEGYETAQQTNNNSGVGERDPYPENEMTTTLQSYPDLRPWEVPFLGYSPVYFASITEHKNHEYPNGFKYADPCGTFEEDGDLNTLKALIQGQVDLGRQRVSCVEEITLNPLGRTGIWGPGELGCFGPNKAADSVIFSFIGGEWKVLLTQRPNRDAWAIPGGMIDAKDGTSKHAFKRELKEETGLDYNELEARGLIHDIGIAYQGYSDDKRNTDNAWMETTAHVSILDPEALKTVKFAAEDTTEVTGICWVNLTEILGGTRPLFASHTRILADAVRLIFSKATKKSSRCDEERRKRKKISSTTNADKQKKQPLRRAQRKKKSSAPADAAVEQEIL